MATASHSSQDHDYRSTSTGGAAKEVGDDLQSLRDDIANLAVSVSRLATEKVGTTVEDVQAKAQERIGEVEKAIRKNPTQSALIAAGVGFVVGLVLSR